MNDLPRQKLKELLDKYGRSICDEPKRLEALLRDYCAEHRREIKALVDAQQAGVATSLMAASSTLPIEMVLAQLTARVHQDFGMIENNAQWAVETWALALGTISITDLAVIHPRVSETVGQLKRVSAGNVGSVSSIPLPNDWQQVDALIKHHGLYARLSEAHVLHKLATLKTEPSLGEPIYQLSRVIRRLKPVELRQKRSLEEAPDQPFWYIEEAYRIKRYITESGRKPVIVTGYGCFGGSYIAQWALSEAAKQLAIETMAHEETVVVRLKADLRGSSNLWLKIEDWMVEVREGSHQINQALWKHYRQVFQSLRNQPEYEISGTDEKQTVIRLEWTSPNPEAKITLPISIDKGRRETDASKSQLESSTTPVPFERSKQLLEILRTLAHALPTQPAKGLNRFLRLIRRAQIPCRLILLLDEVDDWRKLAEISTLLGVKGAMRVVSIADKHRFDQWEQDEEARDWIERTFEVVRCLPIDEHMAVRLCEHYFQIDEHRRKGLFLDFVNGLNFLCRGSPGEFIKVLEIHWGLFGTHRDLLVLSNASDLMQTYHIWATVNRIIEEQHKTIIGSSFLMLHANHRTRSELPSRLKLLLYSLADYAIALGSRGFLRRQLIGVCEDTIVRSNLNLSKDELTDICNRFIDSLVKNGILETRSQPITRPLPSAPVEHESKQPAPQPPSLELVDPIKLRDAIDKTFSKADLRKLCSDLGVRYTELEGETLLEKIMSLIEFHQHRDKYGYLVKKVVEERPHLRKQLGLE